MPEKITNFLFLNQMAGPLFRELAEDLALVFEEKSVLKTGHPDTLAIGSSTDKLIVQALPGYDRASYFTRILSWLKYAFLASLAMFKADRQTAIFIVSNPPLLGPAAWLVNKLRRVPYFVLVYDMHPDTLICFGVLKEGSVAVRLWRWINQAVWNNAEAVFTLGPVMAEKLSLQFDATKTNLGYVGVIPPWADTDNIKPLAKAENPLVDDWKLQGKVVVLYSGNMGVSHDIDSILQAAMLLRDNERVSFLMIGEGAKWQDAVDFQKANQLSNLQVLPFQPEEKLPYTMPLADIALLALDEGAEGLMIPSKMFYYMAAGAAVVGICSGKNDVSVILNESQCGVTVAPGAPEELAGVIKRLIDSPEELAGLKKKARQAAVDKYSRKACMSSLSAKVLDALKNAGDRNETI
jgi:glycosyltransferase involved in cell wall biosynthesis